MQRSPSGPCLYSMHHPSTKLARRAFEVPGPYDGAHQPLEALWLHYLPSALILKALHSMFHTILAICWKYCPEKHWPICHVMATQCLLCNIGTEILNIIEMKLMLQRVFNSNSIFKRCANLSQTRLWRSSRGGVIILCRVVGLIASLVRRKCYYRNLD
jgi:hypothetical protein